MSYSAFLLYGPPGTGKSYLAKAVATSADSTLFSVSSSYLVSRWMGESEKLVSNLFEMARESARQRGEGSESEASRCLKNELLVQMHDLGHDDEKVLVLAATDTLNGLDMDIIKCFSRRIYIPLPNCDAREHMFKVHLREAPHDLNEVQFRLLGLMTEGFSGYDVSVFVKDVLFEPVRKIHGAMFFLERGGMWFPCASYEPGAVETTMHGLAAQGLSLKISPLLPITMTDFCNVLARQKPMMSKLDLAYERFT